MPVLKSLVWQFENPHVTELSLGFILLFDFVKYYVSYLI